MDLLMELEHTFEEKAFYHRFRKCGGCKRRSLWTRISKCHDCRLFCHQKCMTPALTGHWRTEDAARTASSDPEETADADENDLEASGGDEAEVVDNRVSSGHRDKPVSLYRRCIIASRNKLSSIKKRTSRLMFLRMQALLNFVVHDRRRDEGSPAADETQGEMSEVDSDSESMDDDHLSAFGSVFDWDMESVVSSDQEPAACSDSISMVELSSNHVVNAPGDDATTDVTTSVTNIETSQTVADPQFFGQQSVAFEHVISTTRINASKYRAQLATEKVSSADEDLSADEKKNPTEQSDDDVQP